MKTETYRSKDFLNSDLEPTKLVAKSLNCNIDMISQSSTIPPTRKTKKSSPFRIDQLGACWEVVGGGGGRGCHKSYLGRKYLANLNLFLARMRTPKTEKDLFFFFLVIQG